MGDMADVFKVMKERNKKVKANRLLEADDQGWAKHSDYHWYRESKSGRMNYWPTTGLVMIGIKRYRITDKVIQDLIKVEGEGND